MVILSRGLSIGVISGFILGFFLKGVQITTGSKVYTLLLNVDFVPIIGQRNWPEWIEFTFHLVISCIIGVIYIWMTTRDFRFQLKNWKVAFIVWTSTSLLFIPLTFLSLKTVPEVDDPYSISWWIFGHFIYSISLISASYSFRGKKRTVH